MTSRPRISVVMSVYNDSTRVRASIESILAQTLLDWELILINDGSTDGTAETLNEFARKDQRVRLFHRENEGLTRALVFGCQQATAEVIARQDADDLSVPTRFACQWELLQSDSQIGFVSSWADYIGPQGEFLETVSRPSDSREATQRLLNERLGPPAHGTVMFRKSVYENAGGYRPEFYFGQDSDLWMRMAERSRIAYVQESLYLHRRDPGTISGRHRAFQAEYGRLGQACRRARSHNESEQPFLDEAEQLRQRILEYRRSGRVDATAIQHDMAYLIGSRLASLGDKRALKYLWDVIRRHPWHWRAWGRLAQVVLFRKSS